MPKMTKDRAEMVLRRLESFAKLQQRQTDEIGWIALAYSVNRNQAESMIAEAREMLDPKSKSERPGWTVGGLYQRGSNFETSRRRAIRQGSALVAIAHGESVAEATERAELIARAPELLAENERLRAENTRLQQQIERAAIDNAETKPASSSMSAAQFIAGYRKEHYLTPGLRAARLGQTAFNQLTKTRPDLASKVRGRLGLDPFHYDVDTDIGRGTIAAFEEFLFLNW